MSIKSILRSLHRYEEKIQNYIISPRSKVVVADDVDQLPDSLASHDMENVDTVVINNHKVSPNESDESKVSGKSYSYIDRLKNKRKVRKDFDIGFFNNLGFKIVNLFVDHSILGELVRVCHLAKDADMETIVGAARKYYHDRIVDGEGTIHERCDEVTKEFIKQIINIKNNDERMLMLEIYASVIGELDSKQRHKIAEALIKVAKSDEEASFIAKLLFDNAKFNLTNVDPITEEPPEKENCTEYFNTAFNNMTAEDIDAALKSLGMRADEVEPRIKELLEKENLTFDEQAELAELQILHDNIIISGYAGASTGIATNDFIENDFAKACMAEIYTSVSHYGIEEEVFEQVYLYAENHEEFQEDVVATRGEDFDTIVNEATQNEYEEYVNNTVNVTTNMHVAAHVAETGPETGPDPEPEHEPDEFSTVQDVDGKPTSEEKINSPLAKSSETGSQIQERPVAGQGFFVSEVPIINGAGGNIFAQRKNQDNIGKKDSSPAKSESNTKSASGYRPSIINSFQQCKEFIEADPSATRDIITGKVKLTDGASQILVINEYKRMHNTDQGKMLGNASHLWYNRLFNNTRNKTVAIESFLATGNKGIDFERTQKMREASLKEKEA